MALFRKFGINVNDNHNANRVDNLLRLKLKSRLSFLIAMKRNYISKEIYETMIKELQSFERQLNTFISKLK